MPHFIAALSKYYNLFAISKYLLLQSSHKNLLAILNIFCPTSPVKYWYSSPSASKLQASLIWAAKCPFSWSKVFWNSSAEVVSPITTIEQRCSKLEYVNHTL